MWRHLRVAISHLVPTTPIQPYFDRIVNKIITFDGITFTLIDKAQSEKIPSTHLSIDDVKSQLNSGDRLKVILSDRAVLVHSLIIPVAAAGDFKNILETELNSLLPFPDEPSWKLKWRELVSENAITAFVAIVKPPDLQSLFDVIKSARAKVDVVGVRLANKKEDAPAYCDALGNNLVEHQENYWAKAAAVAAVVLFLCVVWTWTLFEANMTTLRDNLRTSQTAFETQAKQNRAQIDLIKSQIDTENEVQRIKNEHIESVKIWHELSLVLPDTVWLQGFSRKGSDVLLEGYAETPEQLIALLEKSKLFVGATFVNAVVQAPGASKQRFNIKVTLQRQET